MARRPRELCQWTRGTAPTTGFWLTFSCLSGEPPNRCRATCLFVSSYPARRLGHDDHDLDATPPPSPRLLRMSKAHWQNRLRLPPFVAPWIELVWYSFSVFSFSSLCYTGTQYRGCTVGGCWNLQRKPRATTEPETDRLTYLPPSPPLPSPPLRFTANMGLDKEPVLAWHVIQHANEIRASYTHNCDRSHILGVPMKRCLLRPHPTRQHYSA